MKPTTQDIWNWLSEVPDPEIPVISLVDLGVIRDVAIDNSAVTITITPTYAGCPATSVINFEVENALRSRGVTEITLKRQLSPAWTTDWIAQEAMTKLENYGIAPPQAAGGPERCPQCKSKNVERISQFGSTPCKAQWRCQDCLEPFDYFKCI